MARLILTFFVMWALVGAGIIMFRAMSGQEKWELVKLLTFSGFCAIIAIVLLMALVVLF